MKIHYGTLVLAGLCMSGCLGSGGSTIPVLPTFVTPALSIPSFGMGYGFINSTSGGTYGNAVQAGQLLPPPTWCNFPAGPRLSYANGESGGPLVLADLSVVVGPNGSWISSGYTQCVAVKKIPGATCTSYGKSSGSVSGTSASSKQPGFKVHHCPYTPPAPKPKAKPKTSSVSRTVLSDKELMSSKGKPGYEFLIDGSGQWQVVTAAVCNAITIPPIVPVHTSSAIQKAGGSSALSAPASIPYFSAALMEYFSARLAMSSGAFLASSGSSQADFLNIPNSSINNYSKNLPSEQAILADFNNQAQLLFSWAFYLRNILTPPLLNLDQPLYSHEPITMESGFSLGALETFAGLVIINPYYTGSNAVDVQQIVFASGNGPALLTTPPPGSSLPSVSEISLLSVFKTQDGFNNNSGTSSALPGVQQRFIEPGFTALQVPLDSSQKKYVSGTGTGVVTFLPVSNPSQPGSINIFSGKGYYAPQESADNWISAPVLSSSNIYRQVTFQLINIADQQTIGPWITAAVGVSGTYQGPYPTSIVLGSQPASGSLQNVDTISDIGLSTQAYGSGKSAPIDCYDDPRYQAFFADQQPWAIVFEVTNANSAGTITTGIVQKGLIKLNSFDFPLVFAQNPLAAAAGAQASQGGGGQTTTGTSNSNSSTNNSGIAFTQRDVWMGAENLYAFVFSSEFSTMTAPKDIKNYSFSYLFLQALYNGHLYSSAANSLYSTMQKNKQIIGYADQNYNAGTIGNISYDYTSENGMTLYPLNMTTFAVSSTTTNPLREVWPLNESRPKSAQADWLGKTSPIDWVFLRALMVMRAFIENTGITQAAFAYLPQIIKNPKTTIPSRSSSFPTYITQPNVFYPITIPPVAAVNQPVAGPSGATNAVATGSGSASGQSNLNSTE